MADGHKLMKEIREKQEQFDKLPGNSAEWLDKLVSFISTKTDVALENYREKFIRSRLYFRISRLPINTYEDYYHYIKKNPEELKIFLDVLTIHVTEFFRDIKPFRYLEKTLLREIDREKRTSKKPIRILSAPCSTGEEAYSLAIIVDHLKTKTEIDVPVTIDAVDIESQVIDYAKRGIYKKAKLKNISPESLQKNFVQVAKDYYQIRSDLKSYIQFFQHNLLKPLAEKHYDLIVCRNFLIYIDKNRQNQVISNFCEILRDKGYLMLGKTEGYPLLNKQHFYPYNLDEHIYQYSAAGATSKKDKKS